MYLTLIYLILSNLQSLITMVDRIQRLKDARTEATKEIDALKLSKNQEFLEYEKKVCLLGLILVLKIWGLYVWVLVVLLLF